MSLRKTGVPPPNSSIIRELLNNRFVPLEITSSVLLQTLEAHSLPTHMAITVNSWSGITFQTHGQDMALSPPSPPILVSSRQPATVGSYRATLAVRIGLRRKVSPRSWSRAC